MDLSGSPVLRRVADAQQSQEYKAPFPILLHAFLLLTVFLVIFPGGTLAIRLKSSSAFRNHWMVQTAMVVLAETGIGFGLAVVLKAKGVSLSWSSGICSIC